MLHRLAQLLGAFCLAALVAAPAQGGPARAQGCGAKEYSYAGLASYTKAHGVAATLVPVQAPSVIDGHVGGWVGVGGANEGPGGVAEWLQVGFAAFSGVDGTRSRLYYEVTRAGQTPRYHELAATVKPGTKHRVAVLEMAKRKAWWRVWVDGRPVTAPIHLPGSHGAWHPQAVAENWNGGTGVCNGLSYRFTDLRLAGTNGGKWKPFGESYVYEDAGYKIVRAESSPDSFLATSV